MGIFDVDLSVDDVGKVAAKISMEVTCRFNDTESASAHKTEPRQPTANDRLDYANGQKISLVNLYQSYFVH